jgi:hypothetical protein
VVAPNCTNRHIPIFFVQNCLINNLYSKNKGIRARLVVLPSATKVFWKICHKNKGFINRPLQKTID